MEIPLEGDNRFVPAAEEQSEIMAPAADIETRSETGMIEAWRAEALERAGYSPREAAEIAARQDIDLHKATDLLELGCPSELALQILL